MTKSAMTILLAAAILGAAAAGAEPPAAPREVNITTDSAPGWLPTEALERQARQTMDRFFAAIEAGRDREAYDLMTEGNRRLTSFADFAAEQVRFRTQAGALRERRVLKLTWTKDPHDAPYPGVYVAIDVAARYANVDRDCGYVVLYQRPAGGAFEVMRTESNVIDNAAARDIERRQSRAALDRMWAELARNCPNFQPNPD